MLYIGVFIVEMIGLFFLAKKLVVSLAIIVYKLTGSHKSVVAFLAILFLPGTIVHELAHMITAGVMFVHVGEIDLVPEIQENGAKLGSVQIGQTDPVRRMIIGVAPVIVGLLTIAGVIYFAQLNFNDQTTWWEAAIFVYLIFEVGNTMFSSKKDMEGISAFLLAIIIVTSLLVGGLMMFGYTPLNTIYNFFISLNITFVESFFKLGSIYLLVPILLDLCVIALAYPFSKR